MEKAIKGKGLFKSGSNVPGHFSRNSEKISNNDTGKLALYIEEC